MRTSACLLTAAVLTLGGAAVSAAQEAPPARTRKVLILLAQGSNVTRAQALDLLKNRPDSLATFFRRNSYGRQELDGGVFGPYPSPSAGAGCDTVAISNELISAFEAEGHSAADYDHVVHVLPPSPSCGWVGLADFGVPRSPNRNSFFKAFNPVLLVHEIGHNFGLAHPAIYDCGDLAYDHPSRCDASLRGHRFDPLGGGSDHFAAFNKGYLGWFEGCNVVDARRSGVFNLMPLQEACGGSIQVLRVSTGNPDEFFYVEYRKNPEVFDPASPVFHSPSPAASGVYFDLAPGDFGDGFSLAPSVRSLDMTPLVFGDHGKLLVNQPYPAPNNVTFTVLSQTAALTQVQILFPGGGTGSNTCLDGSAPPANGTGPIGRSVCGTGGACAEVPHWRPAVAYGAAAVVQNNGTRYQCKPFPFSGHCVQAGYEPGVGTAWPDAWLATGSCPDPCPGLARWNALDPWYEYRGGTRRSRSGHAYSCHATQWCYLDPAHPQHGALGWTDRGVCGDQQ